MARAAVPTCWAMLAASLPSAAAPRDAAAPVATLLADPAALTSWLEGHSPDVAAAAARVAQAGAALGSARLFQNPALTLSVGDIVVGESNPPGLGRDETLIYTAGVSQTFELGKRSHRVASAGSSADSARELYRDELVQRSADARQALGRLVYATERQHVLAESLEWARRAAELGKTRFEQGEISGNDYDRLLLETSTLELDVERSRSDVAAAEASCRAALFAPCDAGGAVIADLDRTAAAVEAAAAPDLAGRPDIQALDDQRKSALEDQIVAKHRAIPDPNVSLAYVRDYLTVSGDQPRSLAVGVTLPLPLFDRGQHDAARAAARAVELESARTGALARATADLTALQDRHRFLDDALRRLTAESIPRSASILETTEKAFEQGEVSMTDLLLARRTHTELLLGLDDVRFEAFSVHNELRRVLSLDAPR